MPHDTRTRFPTTLVLLCTATLAGGCGPALSSEDGGAADSTSSAPGSSGTSSGPAVVTGALPGDESSSGWFPMPPDSDDTGTTVGGLEPTESIGSGERFIDAFVTEAGVLVVDDGGVRLLARGGDVLAEFTSDRPIESAAFDGERLIVADQAMMNRLDAGLELMFSEPLVEGCASTVLLGEGRFVCGPDYDWDRVFYTYDADDGALLSTSEPNTYNGLPMRRVPGLDEFLTVTVGTSPADFHLYELQDDVVTFVNESPAHGGFRADLVQAFWGFPATHLINAEGSMLEMRPEGCAAGSPLDSQCLIPDGELGTLPVDYRYYADMREAGPNIVYAIRPDDASVFPLDPICGEPSCTIEKINVSERSVIATTSISSNRRYALLRPDPFADGVVVIAAGSAPFRAGSDDEQWYDVHYLGL